MFGLNSKGLRKVAHLNLTLLPADTGRPYSSPIYNQIKSADYYQDFLKGRE